MNFVGTGVVTRQGQVTLPKKARDALKLALGSVLEFFYNDDIVVIKRRAAPAEVFKQLAEETRKEFKARGITRKDVEAEIAAHRAGK